MLLRRSSASVLRRSASTTVLPGELGIFSRLARGWWEPTGDMAALHAMNAVRVPWIRDGLRPSPDSASPLAGFKILDAGCGAGLLAEPLARLGADVVAIDASEDVLAAAERHRTSPHHPRPLDNLKYQQSSVEELVSSESGSFDGVVASEVVEHVGDRRLFIASCADLLKPGGSLFITTINRTIASRVAAITVAEDVLRIVPPGTHHWHIALECEAKTGSRFATPEEVSSAVEGAGLRVRSLAGLLYLPFLNRWLWTPNRSVNYALSAQKILK